MISQRKLDGSNGALDILRDGAKRASTHVCRHVDFARLPHAFDHIGRRPQTNVRNRIQPHPTARRSVNQQLADTRHVVARFRFAPHADRIVLAINENFADFFAGQ